MTFSAPDSARTIHIIDAHLTYPKWSDGALNDAMIATATTHLTGLGHRVTTTTVEDGYDAHVEVERYLDADLVIVQTPINWFGAPWVFKRYVDEVFNAGLHSTKLLDNDGRTRSDPARQYGTGGHLHGRGLFVSSTWNAPATAFDDPEGVLFAGKSADDLLLAITSPYRFVGFTVLANYAIYDIFRDTDVAAGVRDYTSHLDRQLEMLSAVGSPRVSGSRPGS